MILHLLSKEPVNLSINFISSLKQRKSLNRYRRGLETCPQAKTSKNGHAYFLLFFDASERRVWLSAESKILASTFGRFRLYRLRTVPCFAFANSLWKVGLFKFDHFCKYVSWTSMKFVVFWTTLRIHLCRSSNASVSDKDRPFFEITTFFGF